MHIKSIKLMNIRSYPKAEMNFSSTINLILGPNNSGKSTILKTIQNLQTDGSIFSKEDIRKNSRSAGILVHIADIDTQYRKLFAIGRNQSLSKDIIFSLDLLEDKTARQQHLIFNDSTHNFDPLTFAISQKNSANFHNPKLDNFNGFSVMEDDDNFIYPFLSKRKTQQFSGLGGRGAAFNVGDDLRNLPSRIQNLSNGSHPYHDEFVKHCKDILGFQIAKVPGNSNNDDKLGIFATASQTIFLESMGEGVSNILGLLSILLTEDNKLFLIEEIENDIHPQSLKKLLDLILEKSKNNQFIISTHSNIVLKYLATAPDAKIFYTDWEIENNPKNKTRLPTTTIFEIENTPTERLKILEKLGYDLFDFDLYKSYIILEESSAERIIRDFLIPEFCTELTNQVKTISANGANNLVTRFDDFLRLFVFIHTSPVYHHRAWVIADGDETGKNNIAKLKEKFSSWPTDNFITFSKKNFEEYYPEEFKNKFEKINEIEDKNKKRDAKKELINEVLAWINIDRENAKKAFQVSAKEVIDLLTQIGITLKK